jgi:phytanoyl-CoA hydroxylase
VLDDRQLESWHRDGFLVLEDLVPADRIAELRDRTAELVDEFDASSHRTVFDTRDQAHGRDTYFLESGGRISFFFEDGAIDERGELTVPKERALNKIGHAMHDLDPVFDRFSRAPELAEIVADVGVADPRLLQSMYIFKQPGIGGEVDLHQDATFLWTEPQSVMGLWFALEDATTANGCLRAVPGAHAQPPRRRFRRDGSGSTTMDVLDPTPFRHDGERPLECGAGTVILLHGQLPHRSDPNTSDRSRHAYTLHLVDGAAAYAGDNWLQRPDLPLRGFGR